MSTEDLTLTTDTLSGGNAIMETTKVGSLTDKELDSQLTQSEMVLDSKLEPDFHLEDQLPGLEDTLDSSTTTHTTPDNGGSGTQELRL